MGSVLFPGTDTQKTSWAGAPQEKVFSSLSRGPALSLQCTLVLTELTNKELVRSSLPFSPVNHCTDRAFLHEGHTQNTLNSNLDTINSGKKKSGEFSGEEQGEGECGDGAAQVPSHGACVTSQPSTASDQTLLPHPQDPAWNPKTQTQPGILHKAGKYWH